MPLRSAPGYALVGLSARPWIVSSLEHPSGCRRLILKFLIKKHDVRKAEMMAVRKVQGSCWKEERMVIS